MKRKSFLNVFLLSIYIVLLFLYVFRVSESTFFQNSVQELVSLLDQPSASIKVFLAIVSIVFNVIALLVEYSLSKFLVLLFIEDGAVSVADVFIAKSVTLVINYLALLIFSSPSQSLQFAANILGILMMYSLSMRRQRNKMTALLFCLPFAMDIFISLLSE